MCGLRTLPQLQVHTYWPFEDNEAFSERQPSFEEELFTFGLVKVICRVFCSSIGLLVFCFEHAQIICRLSTSWKQTVSIRCGAEHTTKTNGIRKLTGTTFRDIYDGLQFLTDDIALNTHYMVILLCEDNSTRIRRHIRETRTQTHYSVSATNIIYQGI